MIVRERTDNMAGILKVIGTILFVLVFYGHFEFVFDIHRRGVFGSKMRHRTSPNHYRKLKDCASQAPHLSAVRQRRHESGIKVAQSRWKHEVAQEGRGDRTWKRL